jgi:tRNA modification GTPase
VGTRGDVVVALSTPWGRAALAVVRLTGPGCEAVVSQIARPLSGAAWTYGRPRRVALFDADGVFDDGLLVLAKAPATVTGEDTAELGLHGNPRLVERLIAAALAAGARLAEPGEFTRRGLLHGKLDLVAAEAVGQLIDATSDDGVRLARAAMDGALTADLTALREGLIDAAAELEARLDWPDDELALQGDDAVVAGLQALADRARALASTYRAGRVWVHGARVALVGAVNAGKSSLFNALLGTTRAIVHPTPGTTRDVVEATTRFGDLSVTLLDTAGERVTDEPIEAAGLALARELIADADLLLVVLRARGAAPDAVEAELLARTAHAPRLIVCNGVDRDGVVVPDGVHATSALRGQGIDDLKRAVAQALIGGVAADGRAIASLRQRDLLNTVAEQAEDAIAALPIAGPAAAAEAVMDALEAIDAITGATTREDVLDAVFKRFCIGK